jgi:hypothetical protein
VSCGNGNTRAADVHRRGIANLSKSPTGSPEEVQTMRIDLIPERDRFIPGWHNRPEPRRAEEFPPEWRWPRRPLRVVRAFLRNLLQVYGTAKSPLKAMHIHDTAGSKAAFDG